MLNITTFADKREFYEFWDAQNHTTHTAADFAFRAVCVSLFHDETEAQCAARLMRAFGPSKRATALGLKPHKTLYDVLYYMLPYERKISKDHHADARILFKAIAEQVLEAEKNSDATSNAEVSRV